VALAQADGGAWARVYRSTSDNFETRSLLTPSPVAFDGRELVYLDNDVVPETSYYYWVELIQQDSHSIYSGPVAVVAGGSAVSFASLPRPNPVTGSGAVFEYTVGVDAAARGSVDVRLELIDASGRFVRTLEQGSRSVGVHRVTWNATDDNGARVRGGIYFLRYRAGSVTRNLKVAVVP